MTDRNGAPEKKPPECQVGEGRGWSISGCPNLKETNLTNMERETYECEVCGERFELWYEDMK